jgi:hypothetical protein
VCVCVRANVAELTRACDTIHPFPPLPRLLYSIPVLVPRLVMHALSECVSERHHSRIVEPFLDIYSTRSSSLLPPPFYSPTSLPIELSFIFVKVKTLDDYQLA